MDCFTAVVLAFFLAGPPADFPKPGFVDPTVPVSKHDLGRFPPRRVCESNLAWFAEHRRWLQWRADARHYDADDFWGYYNVMAAVACLDVNADAWRTLLRAHEADDCGDDPGPHLRELLGQLLYDT